MEKVKRKIGKWSKQEDELLLSGVKKYGARDWPKISTLVMGRNSVRSFSRGLALVPSLLCIRTFELTKKI